MIVDRDTPDITIQRWELPDTQPDMPRVAIPVQTITMTRSNNTTDVSGDLNLPFREFVGRDIDPNSAVERDLRITRQRLSKLGGACLEKTRFHFIPHLNIRTYKIENGPNIPCLVRSIKNNLYMYINHRIGIIADFFRTTLALVLLSIV